MTVVSNVIRNPAGVPVNGASVTVQLVTAGTPGFSAGGTVEGIYRLRTAPDGSWSVDLVPNTTMTPVGTYYRVTESSSGGGTFVYDISVPTGGPFNVFTLLVASPDAPEGLVPAAVLQARIWDGTKYVPAVGATHYIGSADPGSVPDGSEWFNTEK